MNPAAIIDNEQDLIAFIEYAPISIAMFDPEMRYIAASLRWMQDYGLGDRRIVGLSHYEVFPEIGERWKAIHRRALAGELVREDLDRFERDDGSVQWLRWEIQPWRRRDGSIGGIVIVTDDVSRYVRTEASLKHLKGVLRALHGINALITTGKDQDSILSRACEILTEAYGYRSAWGFLQDESGTVRFICESGANLNYEAMRSAIGRGILPPCYGQASAAPGAVVVHNHKSGSECGDCPLAQGYEDSEALASLLRHEGKSYGLLVVSLREDQPADSEERVLFQEVARVVAFALATITGGQARLQAEREARIVGSKLESAMESSSDAIFISDVEGRFINFNEAFATFHKFKSKAECAKTLAEYPGFLDVFMADGSLAPLEQWAVSRALRGEIGTNVEYSLRRKDTGEAWFGSYSFAPIRDDKGEIVGSVVSGRDITEAKRNELKLRESESRFSAIFHSCPVPILFGRSEDGTLMDVNENFVRAFGYGKDEIIGRRSDEFGLLDAEERNRLFGKFAMERHVENMEIKARRKDGRRLDVMASLEPIEISGESCVLGILADITEQKRTEAELREALEAKEALLGELYHRTKNNMLTLISMMSIQAQEHPEQTVGRFTEDVSQRILALSMVHDLLYQGKDLSRIDLGRYLAILAGKVIDNLGRSGSVDCLVESEAPSVTFESANAVALIAVEFLTNSLRHGIPAGRTGKIGIAITCPDPGMIRFRYTDDGVGLPEGFDQASFGGYGTKIARALATQQLGGTMEARSEPGAGVEFIIHFSDDKYKPRI